MTEDIVERLRNCAWSKDPEQWLRDGPVTMDEAADEIERLLTEIPQLIRNERERCAKIADDFRAGGGFITVADEIAAAIRGESEQ